LKQDDLFDWLYRVEKEREKGLTQAQIGERVGWSREAVKDHISVLEKIGAQVFDLCGRRYLITSSNEFKFYFFISKPILIFVIHF
jgi:biotin operon repressor